MKASHSVLFLIILIGMTFLVHIPLFSQTLKETPELDIKVKAFLEENRHDWYDMNVPSSDGKILHDLIVKHGYTRALEIGTSTGHSGIWMAWALAKTGGKLITVEIDERRYKTAVKYFKEAGLSEFIDARLADAHKLVPELKGPFDFVFSDADKHWYKNYFQAVDPNLVEGGCYTTHNVYDRGRGGRSGSYLKFLKSLPNYETTVDESGNGLAISYKKTEK